ncbi:cupin domain-containing protein [Rhodococcus zopfii]|uniref:cupin domain-containing protein n=1 Tax=Rhodococcus zopfii TaxID=43772 RepID=UPI0011110CBE|nr:cupin domain-containing protein [Rhodococcus zopfii]
MTFGQPGGARDQDLPEWARALGLAPHPEGGWYRETWRSDLELPAAALPGYPASRSAGTAILFLLMPGQRSAWHTVRGAELWLYHRGSPVLLEIAEPGPEPGEVTEYRVGPGFDDGDRPQVVVPPGHWQRARPAGSEPSLVGCVVVPGFDFDDFTLPGR